MKKPVFLNHLLKMRAIFFLLFFVFLFKLSAQQDNLPLGHQAAILIESELSKKEVEAHTSVKPYLRAHLVEEINYDSLYQINRCGDKKWLKRKLSCQSLIVVDTTNFQLYIDPLFNFKGGRDLQDITKEKLYTNTRGALVRGNIGKKVSFSTSFLENQSTFPQYIDDYIGIYGVVPGQGRVKPFKLNGYDYARAEGYVSFSPKKYINIQVGHGKHFIGDGYRSLLLSDFAFNYPYLKIITQFSKIQYTNIYASLMNLTAGDVTTPKHIEPLFQKKAAGFQLLSWKVSKNIEWSFFQGMIWKAADSNNEQHFNFFYYNPVIYGALARYGLDEENNIVVGSNLKWKPFNRAVLYGQIMVDHADAGGVQLGLKGYNLFKVNNLNVQLEANYINGNYQHDSLAQSYWHYNQPLGYNNAFTFGSSGTEWIMLLNYRWKRLLFSAQFNMSYESPYKLSFFQKQYLKAETAYLINPVTNLQIVVGAVVRELEAGFFSDRTHFAFIALRTNLFNNYYDF